MTVIANIIRRTALNSLPDVFFLKACFTVITAIVVCKCNDFYSFTGLVSIHFNDLMVWINTAKPHKPVIGPKSNNPASAGG